MGPDGSSDYNILDPNRNFYIYRSKVIDSWNDGWISKRVKKIETR